MLMIYLNLSMLFFIFSGIFMLLMIKFMVMKIKLLIEINLINFSSMNFSLIFYFDYKSFMFMMVVMLISSMIILYSIEYMWFDKFNIRFIYILMMFVISMVMMIIGQNLLMILLGWDGLGLISYCLVIYYNNWNSYNSGMITILTNRLGDIGILISISMMSIYGDWNYLMLFYKNNIFMLMLFLACITKSAQIPFSCWLPMAMAAPTPISALVHSSTLVTAGVYLLIRLSDIFLFNFSLKLLLYLNLMTMLFSGLVAMFENDLKKIIALSTLSQLGLMMMTLTLGFKLLSFFHLIMHAMFKSLLFMCAGIILHIMLNNQDIRNMGILNLNLFLTMMMFNCSNLALCGFFFLSGFYSKEMILEICVLFNLNLFLMLMFYLSIIFTIIYSFRLIYYLVMNFMKFYKNFNLIDNYLMNFSMIMMFINSIYMGNLFNWLMFNNIDMIYLFNYLKFMLLMMIFVSMLMSILINFFKMELFYIKMKNLFYFMKLMWMMNNFILIFIKMFLYLSNYLMMKVDKGWGEMMGKISLKLIYFNLMKIEYLNEMMLMNMMMMFLLIFIFI